MGFVINPFAPAQLSVPPFNTLTPVGCCGFECGQFSANGAHWSTESGAPSFSTSTVRNGARSLRCNPGGVSDVRVKFVTAGSQFLVGRVYVRFATLPSTKIYIICTRDGGAGDTLGVAFNSADSKIYAAGVSSIVLGSTGVAVTTGVWYRIDFKINQASGAKTCDAQVDGVAVGQATATGTIGPGKIQLGTQQFLTAPTADIFYDDFILSHTAANYPFGAGYVNHFVPVADGTHNSGAAGSFIKGSAGANITGATTDSYLLIDEVPLDDSTPDTNDYVTQTNDTGGGSLYIEHVFGPASGISTPTTRPRAVEVILGHHGAAAGNHHIVTKLVDNGTEDTIISNVAAANTGIVYERKQYANPPSGLGGWDFAGGPGNFNALRHRFGYSTDASPDVALDCVMIEAEFV